MTPAVQAMLRRVEQGGVWTVHNVSGAGQRFLAAWLHRRFPGRPLVVVADGLKSQETVQQDLETWLGMDSARVPSVGPSRRPLFYPAWESLPHEGKLSHADVISERLETLVALSARPPADEARAPLIVTNATALVQLTFPPEEIRTRTRALSRGDAQDPSDLVDWLEGQGYEPEAQVTQKGELSLRGGILDVYPLASPWPVRLEFFGSELESLRYFDPLTQISTELIERVLLPPGGELGLLRKWFGAAPGSRRGTVDPAAFPSFRLATLLDHLPSQTLFLILEPTLVEEQAHRYAQLVPPGDGFFIPWETVIEQLDARGMTRLELTEFEAPPEAGAAEGLPDPSLSDLESTAADGLQLAVAEALIDHPASAGRGAPGSAYSAIESPDVSPALSLGFASLDAYRPIAERFPEPQVAEAQRREFFVQLHRWLRQGYVLYVFCNNPGERDRFQEIWREYGLGSGEPEGPKSAFHKPGVADYPEIQIGSLARGFLYEPGRLVVVTDAEVFGRYRVQRARRLKSPHAAAMRSALEIDFADLEEGDFVVHLQYGIGRYLGCQFLPTSLGRRPTAATEASVADGQECLVIQYAPAQPDQPPPKLYVPVTEAHLVSKYVGAGKMRPPLNTLGGTRWFKAKAHAERAVADLAAEMLAVHAARASELGEPCAPDTTWQHEFETAFLYEETPDQLRAIRETKTDMESPRPMDRLICGDVGFGKTEVALRAAFKMVMHGKQTAILVPTTVLAQQHYNTFRERMADYPVRIELLSRFRTHREQQRVIRDLAAGAVDIVIGTHRLVQKDIAFKNLGLVVIDEEQRFGVLQKERFKLLRRLVDVLTLSATPIPRTLYLALTGARDMSTIETPPHDRLPVETIVIPYDESVIRNAIQRELNRQGQVFFLHNRVDTIDAFAIRLQALAPTARIVVGHGQMESDHLEEVMTRFINGEADVLLSTTIIESGLDISNANTIIIDRADRFGLSDLYQLRGRVGRYKHQAYAYLLLPRHAGLLTDARKRLSAIKQYSSLGSGFKIAMRDLEIRGAGNLLGPEQSGHITAVGFELYCQLLKQSISSLKGEEVKPRVEVQVRLDFLALNPGEELDETTAATETVAMKASEAQPPGPSPENIRVPREGVVYADEPTAASREKTREDEPNVIRASACIPYRYVAEPRGRIEIYRKLAQARELAELKLLATEVRDRFGVLPPAVELLFRVTELKISASAKGIQEIETRGDRLMLTRNNDLVTLGGKFPRLTKRQPKARLNEIQRLVNSL